MSVYQMKRENTEDSDNGLKYVKIKEWTSTQKW